MIDWPRVMELREEVGAEDFNEVVDLFLDEVQEVITRLRNDPDPAQFEADFHFLKGSALSLGFAALSALCETGESRSAAGQDVSGEFQALFSCYADSRAYFLAELPQHLAPSAA